MPWIRIWPSLLFLVLLQNAFAKDEVKVASASPSITQMIYSLGGAGKLVARSDYCKDPVDVQAKPSLGSPYSFQYEKAKKLGVNLVISPRTSLIKFKQRLKQMNIELLELRTRSFQDLFSNMTEIANRLGLKSNVIQVNILKQQYNAISKTQEGSFLFVHAVAMKNGRVQGLYISGQNSIYSDLLSKMGLVNLSENSEEESHLLSLESLLLKKPRYIFWQDAIGDKYIKSAPLNKLTGKHILIDDAEFKVPGPKMIKFPSRISKLLEVHQRVKK